MRIPVLPDDQLTALCDVLGDTSEGLAGAEIRDLLHVCGVEDPLALPPGHYLAKPLGGSKRERLRLALGKRQQDDGAGNQVIAFVQAALAPVRYLQRHEEFEKRRDRVNRVLAFAGIFVGEDGKVRQSAAASTISEARRRCNRMRKALEDRAVHPDVLAACRLELLVDENYFHAVLEATKSVAQKLRTKAGVQGDGAQLVDEALAPGKTGTPRLAVNSLRTDSERSEQVGLAMMIKGMFSTFRNPTAHEPKMNYMVRETDALDLLTLASYIHRRLDTAISTQPRATP